MAVYQTFVNAMNERIRRTIAVNNPFVFKHISNLKVKSHDLLHVLCFLPFWFDFRELIILMTLVHVLYLHLQV